MPNFREVFQQERVTPIPGERGRFRVQSRTRARVEHLVDLMENDGFGRCSCEQHFYRNQPILNAIKRGEEVREPSRCFHILRVREYLADCVILKMGQDAGEAFASDKKIYKLDRRKTYEAKR